jgi:hypothetical protein
LHDTTVREVRPQYVHVHTYIQLFQFLVSGNTVRDVLHTT